MTARQGGPVGQRTSRARRPRGRPPGSSAAATIARLLEAAQEHFGAYGLAGARMTEIAERAGITHSSIYQYFSSKTDLYCAVFAETQKQLLPRYVAAIDGHDTFREQIRAIFLASAHVHGATPTITPFLASVPLELRRNPDLLPRLQLDGSAIMAPFAEMFAGARRRNEIPTDVDDLDLLIGCMGAAMGIGLLAYGLETEMDEPVSVALAALDGGLFTR